MTNDDWKYTISQRRHTEADLPFMQKLYASSRRSELALINFSEQEKIAFILQQFVAQYSYYTQHYCTDSFNIILLRGKSIGRLFVDYWADEIRIVDIAIIPELQGKGIGSYLFKQLFEQARESRRTVTIHVEYNNPAKKLYEKLGFQLKTKTNDIYLLMEWTPEDDVPPNTVMA